MKCIDVWMVSCLAFTIFCLIEFCVVIKFLNIGKSIKEEIQRRKEESVKNCKRCKDLDTLFYRMSKTVAKTRVNSLDVVQKISENAPDLEECTCEQNVHNVPLNWVSWEKLGKNTDKLALLVVPIAFLIFNLIYWTVYIQLAIKDSENLKDEG